LGRTNSALAGVAGLNTTSVNAITLPRLYDFHAPLLRALHSCCRSLGSASGRSARASTVNTFTSLSAYTTNSSTCSFAVSTDAAFFFFFFFLVVCGVVALSRNATHATLAPLKPEGTLATHGCAHQST